MSPLTVTQKKNLENLAQSKEGLKFTPVFFPYTSGQIGNYFIQSCAIEENGNWYKTAILSMTKMIRETIDYQFEIVAGGETRDWDFSNPTAVELGKAHAKLYKKGKVIGAKDMNGQMVVPVADLNNEGSSPKKYWIPIINNAGGIIKDIYFFIDRLEDGVQVMKDLGLNRHALLELNGATWDHLKKIGKVSDAEYNSLNARLENKEVWAHNMLRCDTGLNQLGHILNSTDKDTYDKGVKIINVGYPELKEELLDRMKVQKIITEQKYLNLIK